MKVYAHLLQSVTKIKKEIIIKSILGLMISLTYIMQAVLMSKVINAVWKDTVIEQILFFVAGVVLLVFIRGLLMREVEGYSKVLAARIKSKLRMAIYDHIYKLGPGYMNAKRSGKVTSMMLDGIESLEPFFVNYLPQVLTVLVSGTVIFLYLSSFDLVSSIILIVSMILCILVPIITVPLISRNVSDYWSGYSALTSQYIDTIQGMTTLKTLNTEATKGAELKKDASEFYHKSIRNTGISMINSTIMVVLSAVTSSITVIVVAYRVSQGAAPEIAVTAFLFLAVECARPMMDLNHYWHSSFLGLSVAKDYYELLETKPKVADDRSPEVKALDGVLPSIQLKGISFTYPTGTKALSNVSLEIPAGAAAAIVGRSGSGKSTILNLLLRFYDVQEGCIFINGIDIKKYSLDYLQKNIAVVFQDTFLFYGTIADNIRMARPEASDKEVWEAAKAASAHDFIMKLPKGYDTLVGERGLTLSGGERQRISLARAIIKNASIILLDEATSSIDAQSEALIQDALNHLTQNHTIITVAHRLSTIQDADVIFVMEKGELVESGSHEELLARKGVYGVLAGVQEGIMA